jgi:hypothetical protein
VAGLRLAGDAAVRIPLGGTAEVQVQALPDRQGPALDTIRFGLGAPPRGVTLRGTSLTPGGVTLTVKADANIAQAGESGNLIVEAFGESPAAGKQRVSLGVLPSIPIEVVKPW